jgi:sec-independent protein translocase protein TatA
MMMIWTAWPLRFRNHPAQYIAKTDCSHPTLNPFEILLILAIALLVLGPERLPEVIRAGAKLMRELRAASNTVMRELSDAMEDEPKQDRVSTPVSEPRDKPPGQS